MVIKGGEDVNLMAVLIFIIIVLVIFGLPIFLFIKRASKKGAKQVASFWEGKLVDKRHLEYKDDDEKYTQDVYSLYFEKNTKEKIRVNVSKDMFDKWEVGQRAKKTAGEKYPKKV